jgi:hypothetical protein
MKVFKQTNLFLFSIFYLFNRLSHSSELGRAWSGVTDGWSLVQGWACSQTGASWVGSRGSCYRQAITPQVASATSVGAWREALHGSGQQKELCALGARGPRESLVEGDERKGNQSPHLCELLGRGANGIHKTVRSVSQEVIEFQSSIPLEAL